MGPFAHPLFTAATGLGIGLLCQPSTGGTRRSTNPRFRGRGADARDLEQQHLLRASGS
jgi:hypothetical protein